MYVVVLNVKEFCFYISSLIVMQRFPVIQLIIIHNVWLLNNY